MTSMFKAVWAVVAGAVCLGLGPIDPPAGPVAPTGRTLDEIYTLVAAKGDPRTPITTLPITISQSGSYYLAFTPASFGGGVGITISASNVTIDLNGYTLAGNGNTPAGSNHAISVTLGSGSARRTGIAVRNGMIRDWNGSGIEAANADGVQVTDVQVLGCGLSGVRAGDSAQLTRVVCRSNRSNGFELGSGAEVRTCTAVNNGPHTAAPALNVGVGIIVGDGSLVDGCVANLNSHGITATTRATITNCTTNSNDLNGVWVTNDCFVHHNSSGANGVLVTTGAGFLVTGTDNRIENNNATKNDVNFFLSTTGLGNIVMRNSASGATLGQANEFVSPVGNHVGQVLVNPGINFPDAPTGANFIFN